ncbi:membrane or secreted protein [uncultured Fibrella sp.]|uniref:membrane or secreted protein n=1 Tax=uncultured Fibrella sp. TaxID=1284596 RepID=UPI0035CA22C0
MQQRLINPLMHVRITFYASLLLTLVGTSLFAQKSADVYVDKAGVLRWGTAGGQTPGSEVQGFGTNYTAPFAHAYRTAKRMGIPLEKAIDNDVYHFARLGFDSYRVHVWDTEISDTLGNLLDNEHLKLFDYLLKQLKDRGIKFVITPIAYWDNGYPEPGDKTPSFSTKYGKEACLTNPDAIKAQENYLYQFLNHVNPYTGVAYKNEPDLILFEVSNEPHHGGTAADVTTFINRMVSSMRRTGCKKPIFYNISHSIHLVDGYVNANIQGGTFQWYPTGLGAQHELRGNLLPNADRYDIPFANNPAFRKMGKIVYEFDAADVGRSYIYPALARSFREAGMQLAHQFAYDPTFMAAANTEYNTHFMNLAYAPQKALSLMLAAAVFHRVPMYKKYGAFPLDTAFDAFRVSYQKDLAELVTDKQFIYTNTTKATLPAPDKLEQIAGFGNSSVVTYGGKGAYFIDRIEPGVWRLEVMPDAIWVQNIFGRNSPKKENAVINWRAWPMTINLPDLGADFSVQPMNEGNTGSGKSAGNSLIVSPGTYLLIRQGVTTRLTGASRWKNIRLGEFTAPATSLKKTYVLHQPVPEATAGQPLKLEASIVSVNEPDAVGVYVTGTNFWNQKIKLEKQDGYTYAATIPDQYLREGAIRYYLTVTEKGQTTTYPAGLNTAPTDWDFYGESPYQVRVVAKSTPITLFNARTDADQVSRTYLPGSGVMPTTEAGQDELRINVDKLATTDPEDKKSLPVYDYSMRYNFTPHIAGRRADLGTFQKLVFRGRALNNKPCTVQLALISRDGSIYGGTVLIEPASGTYSLPLSQLKPVSFVTLPRPYPSFLPYFINTNTSGKALNLTDIETLQLSIGPGIPTGQLTEKQGVGIVSVTLE